MSIHLYSTLLVNTLARLNNAMLPPDREPLSFSLLQVLFHRGGGSGPSYITGWLSAFTCFDTDGNFIGRKREVKEFVRVGDGDGWHYERQTVVTEFPLINTNKICHNVVSCPVKIDDDGVEYDGTLFAGQVVFEAERVEEDVYPTVRPRYDWCMTVVAK